MDLDYYSDAIWELIGAVIATVIFLPIACILDHKYGT